MHLLSRTRSPGRPPTSVSIAGTLLACLILDTKINEESMMSLTQTRRIAADEPLILRTGVRNKLAVEIPKLRLDSVAQALAYALHVALLCDLRVARRVRLEVVATGTAVKQFRSGLRQRLATDSALARVYDGPQAKNSLALVFTSVEGEELTITATPGGEGWDDGGVPWPAGGACHVGGALERFLPAGATPDSGPGVAEDILTWHAGMYGLPSSAGSGSPPRDTPRNPPGSSSSGPRVDGVRVGTMPIAGGQAGVYRIGPKEQDTYLVFRHDGYDTLPLDGPTMVRAPRQDDYFRAKQGEDGEWTSPDLDYEIARANGLLDDDTPSDGDTPDQGGGKGDDLGEGGGADGDRDEDGAAGDDDRDPDGTGEEDRGPDGSEDGDGDEDEDDSAASDADAGGGKGGDDGQESTSGDPFGEVIGGGGAKPENADELRKQFTRGGTSDPSVLDFTSPAVGGAFPIALPPLSRGGPEDDPRVADLFPPADPEKSRQAAERVLEIVRRIGPGCPPELRCAALVRFQTARFGLLQSLADERLLRDLPAGTEIAWA